MKKAKEFKDQSSDELVAELKEKRVELFQLRNRTKQDKMEKPHLISQTKKEIARILTVIREKSAS